MALYGPDVSDYQTVLPPADFLIIKATEGRTWRSENFPGWRDEAEGRAVPRFFYHYARPGNDPRADAENFMAFVGGLRRGEGIALDFEERGNPQALQDWAITWLDEIEHQYPSIKAKVLFYCYRGLVGSIATDQIVQRMPALWIAAYGRNTGREDPTWAFDDDNVVLPCRVDRWERYTIWQYTERPIDWNRADCSLTDLLALTHEGRPAADYRQPESNVLDRRSPSGRTILAGQPDGNMAAYVDGVAKWATATFGPNTFVMQSDGNLVVYGPHDAQWASNTGGHPGATLAVQDDGNVVIYHGDNGIWATGTASPDPAAFPSHEITVAHSPSGQYRFVQQLDGNLVLYDLSTPDAQSRWASGTSGNVGARCILQGDGNLVVYAADGHVLWSSQTSGFFNSTLAVQDDGNVVLYHGGSSTWATGTVRRGEASVPDAEGWINDQQFFLGVAGFQEAMGLATDGVVGPATAQVATEVIARGGYLRANFHVDEFRCTHCGQARAHWTLLDHLQALRDAHGPLDKFSSFRCPQHPIEAAKATPGQHAEGRAWDPNPYLPRSAIDPIGFTGIGISYVVAPGMVSHVDTRAGGLMLFPDNQARRPLAALVNPRASRPEAFANAATPC